MPPALNCTFCHGVMKSATRVASRSNRFARAHACSAGGDEAVQGSALSTSGTVGGDLYSYTCSQSQTWEVSDQEVLYNKINRWGTDKMANGDTVILSSGNYAAGVAYASTVLFYLDGLYGSIHCEADDQTCELDGAGARMVMYVQGTGGSLLELRSIDITNGSYGSGGGGLYIYSNAQVSLVMCSVTQNQVTSGGGGIYVDTSGTTVDLYGVSFSGNTSPDGPDIQRNDGTVTVQSTCSAGEN